MKYHLRKSADCYASKDTFGLAEIERRIREGEIEPSWEARSESQREWVPVSTITTVQPPPNPQQSERESRNPPHDALCYILRGDQQQGPYTPAQIRSMWAAGQITVDTLYWFEGLPEWFPARNFCEPAAISSTTASPSSGVGVFLTILGIAIAAYFLIGYDTSVSTSVGRVHNQGLMQNRQLGCIAGMVITVIGIGVAIAGSKKSSP